ncbi:MAG: hypothetical protein K0U69_14895, partial [Actinomycetia bacterium]|nr:hypothetical protein [Actinomycetes bacterium]
LWNGCPGCARQNHRRDCQEKVRAIPAMLTTAAANDTVAIELWTPRAVIEFIRRSLVRQIRAVLVLHGAACLTLKVKGAEGKGC